MEIKRQSEGLSKADIFRMTQDTKVELVKNHGGEVLTLLGYALYEDVNSSGNPVDILAIKCEEGNFATNSKTFIDSFIKMVDFFKDEGVNHLEIIEGVSKGGRTFFDCSYVD